MTSPLCKLVDQLTEEFIGDHVTRQDDAESPGAGRAKLRLSRGFPRCLAYDVIPYKLVDQLTEEFMGGHVARQDDPAQVGRSSV